MVSYPSTCDRWLGSPMSSSRPLSRYLNRLGSRRSRPFSIQTMHVRYQDAQADLRGALLFLVHARPFDREVRGSSVGWDCRHFQDSLTKTFGLGIDDRLSTRKWIGCSVRANNARLLPIRNLCR